MSEKHEVEKEDGDRAEAPMGLRDSVKENEGGGDGDRGSSSSAKEMLVDGSFEQSKVAANSWTHTDTVGGWKSDTQIETWGKGF